MEAWVSAFWMDSSEASICCCAACHWVEHRCELGGRRTAPGVLQRVEIGDHASGASLIEAIDAETAALEDWMRSGST